MDCICNAFKDFYECKGTDFLGIDWLAKAFSFGYRSWPLGIGFADSVLRQGWQSWQGPDRNHTRPPGRGPSLAFWL